MTKEFSFVMSGTLVKHFKTGSIYRVVLDWRGESLWLRVLKWDRTANRALSNRVIHVKRESVYIIKREL